MPVGCHYVSQVNINGTKIPSGWDVWLSPDFPGSSHISTELGQSSTFGKIDLSSLVGPCSLAYFHVEFDSF
jgi:hypothetical protein